MNGIMSFIPPTSCKCYLLTPPYFDLVFLLNMMPRIIYARLYRSQPVHGKFYDRN